MILSWVLLIAVCALLRGGSADHHGQRHITSRQSNNAPLQIANWCNDDVWPGIYTQGGNGPSQNGFHLAPGSNQTLWVGNNWQGRVWGRTNCSFGGNSGGQACETGDCAGVLNCQIAGQPPATLAEITLQGSDGQTFYDMSLVDGYNLPMAIVLLPNGNSQLQNLQSNKTNPSCVASVGDLAAPGFNPYSNGQQFLGTSSSDPLAFEPHNTYSSVADWCPWDLQVNAPLGPGDGVYPYPDGNVPRPVFDPCLSACAKYSSDQYCCTGSYDGPNKCSPNYYSKVAKQVCPDAYSYAYDDEDSTFVIPQGGGFQIIFCPGGRSTNILGFASASSSSGSSFASKGGWLLIDGRAVKAILAGIVVLTVVLT